MSNPSDPSVSPRVACLFACNDYQEGSGFDRLEHPNKKASELKVKLQSIGWDTKKCLNACCSDLFSQRTVLLQNLQPNTLVLLHIGAHGFVSSDGQLYMAFRDSQAHDRTTCVNLYDWLQPLHDLTSSRGSGRDRIAMNNCAEVNPGCTTLVVLDCCQDFKASDAVTSGPPGQISQLRRHDTEMVILYACHVGRHADDVSYLTDAFMEFSEEAGASLPRFLPAVRDKVLQKSNRFQQVRWEGATGTKAFEIVLNPRQTLPAVSATSIGHAISDEELVAQEEQQPSTLVISTNQFNDVALVFWILTLCLSSASSVFWLCGFARKEWSVRGTFMPYVITTIWVSFSHGVGDFEHGNLCRISQGLSSVRQNWLALEWKIYCIGFPTHLLARAIGEALRDGDETRVEKTKKLFCGSLIAVVFFVPLLSLWRTRVDRLDGVHLKTSRWWQMFGVCVVVLMTVNLVLLSGEATLSCLDKIHFVHMIILVLALTGTFYFASERPLLHWFSARSWFGFYVVALLVVLIAALLQNGHAQTSWEANAGRSAAWIWSSDYNWSMVYLLFFLFPAISVLHFLVSQPVGS